MQQKTQTRRTSTLLGSSLPKSCSHLECQISCSRTCEDRTTRVFWSRSRQQFVGHNLQSMSLQRSSCSVGAHHHGYQELVVEKGLQSSSNVNPRRIFSVFPGIALVINLHADSDNMRDQNMPISPDLRTRLVSFGWCSAGSREMPLLAT